MFESLTSRLSRVFTQLRRRGKLSEQDVDSALREVRLALLEADVHFEVVKNLVDRVRARALGVEVSKALNPAEQVIKIVNDELIATLGEPAPLNLSGPRPRVIMLVGLQGSGKTTAAAKLARMLRSAGERVMLVAGDPYRPAAAEQLRQLGARIDVEVEFDAGIRPEELSRRAVQKAAQGGYSALILDTAGRSQLDQQLMDELGGLASQISPIETLLVVDSMLGQEALNIARGFRDHVEITGLIVTKIDGDARGGAAISIRSVTGLPIKFLGTGEKLDAIEKFDASRLASRILGMGDILGLIEKAEAGLDGDAAKIQATNLGKGRFTLEDWLEQIKQVKRMGPIREIMDMLPGQLRPATNQVEPDDLERALMQSQAIISSMTRRERRVPEILNASRRRRIAAGSGTTVQQVNKLIRQFRQAEQLLTSIRRTGRRGGFSLPK